LTLAGKSARRPRQSDRSIDRGGVANRVFSEAAHPGWDTLDGEVAQAFGEAWQQSRRTLLLIVPSIVARVERNFLLNPDHPEFARVEHGLHHPVWWDDRLFSRG
jgi:RES domain-containing protein